jgi:hypothetical protein
MLPHQQRVVEELDQLSERLSRLCHFFDTSTYSDLSEAEKARLQAQEHFMRGYQLMLECRIAAFEPEAA